MAGFKRQFLSDMASTECRPALGALAGRRENVFCQCQRCGHSALVEASQLVAQLGPDMVVAEVGTRMRCSGCGAKDVATLAGDVAVTHMDNAASLHLAAS